MHKTHKIHGALRVKKRLRVEDVLGRRTSIAVHRKTLEKLEELRRFKESYEDVIWRLIKFYEKHGGKEVEEER